MESTIGGETDPEAVSRPARRPSRVLFPLPEAPMIASTWPAGTSNEMPRRISTRPDGMFSMIRVRFSTVTIVGAEGENGVEVITVDKMKRCGLVPLLQLVFCSRRRGSLAARHTLINVRGPVRFRRHTSGRSRKGARTGRRRRLREADVVTFGDSLTQGVSGKSYPAFLQDLLDQNGYSYRVDNQGVSGDTTTDGLARIEKRNTSCK